MSRSLTLPRAVRTPRPPPRASSPERTPQVRVGRGAGRGGGSAVRLVPFGSPGRPERGRGQARGGPGGRLRTNDEQTNQRAEPAPRPGVRTPRPSPASLPRPGPPRSLLVIGAPDGRREVGGARTPRLSPAPWRSRSGSPRVDVPNTMWGCRRSAFRESRRDTFRSIVSLAPTVAIRQLILHFPQFLKSMCGRGWGLGLGGVGESSHRKRVPFLAYAKMWKDQSV